MSDRYDVNVIRKWTTKTGEEQSQWTKVGTMFRNKSGESFSIVLDLLPMPEKDSGQARMVATVPKPREESAKYSGGQGGNYGGQQRQAAPTPQQGFGQVDEDGFPF